MIALIEKNADILIPNTAHQNFTKTDRFIPSGKKVKGKLIRIQGKRKGEDFTYRLFQTEKGELIFETNIKPMKTEVTLGANGLKAATPLKTEIKMPNKAIQNAHLIGAVAGTIGGFMVAKKMKKTGRTTFYYAIGGAIAGYVVGRIIAGKPIIDINSPAIIEKA
jgi:hypothetical protein